MDKPTILPNDPEPFHPGDMKAIADACAVDSEIGTLVLRPERIQAVLFAALKAGVVFGDDACVCKPDDPCCLHGCRENGCMKLGQYCSEHCLAAVQSQDREDDRPTPYPEGWPNVYNASHEPCDMLRGPCVCGAWHRGDDQAMKAIATLQAKASIEITDEMVERARKAYFDGFARSTLIVHLMRAALEAALNG